MQSGFFQVVLCPKLEALNLSLLESGRAPDQGEPVPISGVGLHFPCAARRLPGAVLIFCLPLLPYK